MTTPRRALAILCLSLAACHHAERTLDRIHVATDAPLKAASTPALVAAHLDNPMSPRITPLGLAVVESGKGTISAVRGGKLTPLISGFGLDQFAGYTISAQGITVDPETNTWIVAAAEGSGRVLLFDPKTFPTSAARGKNVPLEGATDDNPYATVIAGTPHGPVIVASGGTKQTYTGRLNVIDPAPLRPSVSVTTGLIGLAVDPRSGDVFAAVFGNGNGSVIRWNAADAQPAPKTVVGGLTNPVDVAFTREGTLLVLEIGKLGTTGGGRLSVIAGGKAIPFITGLDNPTGLSIGPDDTLYITELGTRPNATAGTLISLRLAAPEKRGAQ